MTPAGNGEFVLAGVPKRLEQRIASLKLTVTPEGTIQGMTIEETDGVTNSFTFSGEVDNPCVRASAGGAHRDGDAAGLGAGSFSRAQARS